jgi:DNA-binding transcriptional LysR family regulator
MHCSETIHPYNAWMTFDELAAFVSIASDGGFTSASRKLHRSQPAISRRIRQLEHSVGAALFERAGRSVRLTAAGRALLPHAETALAALRDGRRAAREAATRPEASLPLRVAIVGTLADAHLVQALRAFQKRFGAASISLRTATSREVSALVRSGEADLGLRYNAEPDPMLEETRLGAERLHVVVPARHRVRARRLRDLSALAAEKWLGFPGPVLEHQLIAAGIATPAITPVDSLTAQKRLVEAGLGIALLPRSSFREELRRKSVRTIEVASLRAETPVLVVQRRGGHAGVAARTFVDLLERFTPDLREPARRVRKRARAG